LLQPEEAGSSLRCESRLACHTQEEIAQKVDISQNRVSEIIDNIRKLKLQELDTPDSIKYFDVWNFSGCAILGEYLKNK